MKSTFSIITFNTAGLPLMTKNYKKRFDKITEELARINPTIICLQEVWTRKMKEKIISSLESHGYKYSYYPKTVFRANGLLVCSKEKILDGKYIDFKPIFRGFNISILEFFGCKGYSSVKIQLPDRTNLHVLNTHLSAYWTREKNKDPMHSSQADSIRKMADDVNSLGEEKIIAVGDFNFRQSSWLYKKFIEISGMKDAVKGDIQTNRKEHLFKFPHPDGWGRLDYTFIKNIPENSVLDAKLVMEESFDDIGYLSDHIPVLTTFDLSKFISKNT